MAVEVILPRVDMDMTTGKIAKWFVEEGGSVAEGQPLFEIESDKAAMEIESPAAGVLSGVTGRPGDELPVGTVVGWIVAPGETFVVPKPAPAGSLATPTRAVAADDVADTGDFRSVEAHEERAERATPKARRLARDHGLPLTEVAGSGPSGRVQASDVIAEAAKRKEPISAPAAPSEVQAGPAARRLAAELGVALEGLQGTGEKGVVTKEDVKTAFRAGAPSSGSTGAALPELPVVDFAKFGPVETTPLSRIKRVSGPRLHASWLNIPHVTHCDEADITELEAFRQSLDDKAKSDKQEPYRVSLLPLVVKCTVAALKAFPLFNSALVPAKDALVRRNYWNIGVAIDTADGLVIAVVRDADRKGVTEIARELAALSAKARDGKLTPADMQGATFTISSLGGIGGTAFTPIVNGPEVAILGVVRATMAPVWDGAAFQPRLMLPLCLSYDHRVIDGAAAARFVRHLSELLGDLRLALL
jgi:pyruvate dehydrogenase E2 component (dihydrolipoamide acetyltransferase)